MKPAPIKQAVILAGGRGARLKPLTDNIPKPMMPVADRPMLWHLIENLKTNGIEEIILLVGYLSEKIVDYFGNGSKFNVSIKYSRGNMDMETGTRLKNAKKLLHNTFLLLYGDNYWPVNLKKMTIHYHRHNKLAMTTVYANKDGMGEYGPENNIKIDKNSRVLMYDKKRKAIGLNGVDIGFFILDKKVLDFIPDRNSSFEKDILPLLVKGKSLIAYVTDERYYYITTKKDLDTAGEFLRGIYA